MCESVGIYVHVPFCLKKCRYCDFYSVTSTDLIKDYVTGLIKEIRFRCASIPSVTTVYFGGGTPSLLAVGAVSRIMDSLRQSSVLSSDAEITFEINPGTVDEVYLKDLRQTGVNRVSIGVQSMRDDKLAFLGRIHSAGEALQVIEMAGRAGFDQICMDLMYALPEERAKDLHQELEQAAALGASHLSCYTLGIEAGTPLYRDVQRRDVIPLDASRRSALFRLTSKILERRGYDHYEISNFAKGPKNRSRHNSGYWAKRPYLGFGPGAHSFNGQTRTQNAHDVGRYVECLSDGRLPVVETEVLTSSQQMLETVMLGLRTREGINIDAFESAHQVSFIKMFAGLSERISREGMGGLTSDQFSLTLKGWAHLDHILESFAEMIE